MTSIRNGAMTFRKKTPAKVDVIVKDTRFLAFENITYHSYNRPQKSGK